jgi:hypothetical protein
MRTPYRNLRQEESGFSTIIGAILVFTVLAAIFGTVQAYYVPRWNQDMEYDHLDTVLNDMMALKSDIEDVALFKSPKSSDIHMGMRYPDRIFLVNSGTGVAGSLTSDNMAISIEYTIDGPGAPTITANYTSNRISLEVQGTIDSPKLVYEHGIIIKDYGDARASPDEQSLVVGDEIFIPILTGNLTSISSMDIASIETRPLSQTYSCSSIHSVEITMDTNYPEVWEQLLAGTSMADTIANVDLDESQIIINSTAIKKITFPSGDMTADALYAGLVTFSTTSVPEPAIIIGGGTGTSTLHRTQTRYIPMFDAGMSATESDIQQPMPVAGTISDFYIILNGSPGNNNSYTFVVRKNGASTTVTCTISDTDTTGSDLTNFVDFDIGDLISIMATPASSPTARSMHWTAKFSLDE